MTDVFFNGLGAVFVINLLAWLKMLGIGLFVFGAIYGIVLGLRGMFNFTY